MVVATLRVEAVLVGLAPFLPALRTGHQGGPRRCLPRAARRAGHIRRYELTEIAHETRVLEAGRRVASSSFYGMATTVLRVRLIGGERMDLTYDEPDVLDEDQLVEQIISTLANDSGVLRTKHGDRLVVLYGRGIAAMEVAPRGAVL